MCSAKARRWGGPASFDGIGVPALARVSLAGITPFGVCDIFALVKNPFGSVLSKDEAGGLPLALEGTPNAGGRMTQARPPRLRASLSQRPPPHRPAAPCTKGLPAANRLIVAALRL
jgi:hypothetical protein